MSKHPTDPAITPLVEGYKQFRSKYFGESKSLEKLVTHDQKPKILVIACCDSRVDPAIVLGSKPGELFVVRNVANLVPPFESDLKHHGTSAALEFGVLGLEVKHIIVFGHSHCGGIRALMDAPDNAPPSNFITAWMDIADSAKAQVLKDHPECSTDEKAHHCEKDSLIISLKNLETFPWIRELAKKKELSLHAWYFDITSGTIDTYQAAQDQFIPLDSDLF